MGAPTRILLLRIPALLRDLIEQAVAGTPDCQVIRDNSTPFELLLNPLARPDVVVVGINEGPDSSLVPALLALWPTARIIAVPGTGEGPVVYELLAHETHLGEISTPELVQTLQATARERRPGGSAGA